MGKRALLYGFVIAALGLAGTLALLGILAMPPMVWIAIAVIALLGIITVVFWGLYGGHPVD